MAKIYKGSVGIGIELDTLLPYSTLVAATAVAIAVKFPDATTADWSAAIVPNTGKIRHVAQTNDLGQVGTYLCQAKLTFGSVITKGDTVNVGVYDVFK